MILMNTPILLLKEINKKYPFYESLWLKVQPIYEYFNKLEPQRILLNQSDPLEFLAYFVAIASTEHQLFLSNFHWQNIELQQVIKLVNPHLIIHHHTLIPTHTPPDQLFPLNPLIMIATGGTSGNIRFAMHNWKTLTASVQGFLEYFNVSEINSFCLLPLYHVSGLMQFVRSLYSGGNFQVISYSEIKEKKRLKFNFNDYFVSFVPTQLQYCLTDPDLTQWLTQFKTILLGGAPSWNDLLQQARKANLPLALTYGMTETASQIATLKPSDFLSGINNCGQILPHAKVEINEEKTIIIQSKSLFLGYYPKYLKPAKSLETEDLGLLDEQGYLTIIGRKNKMIISGGEKFIPLEIETIIKKTQLVKDIVVLGIPDAYWGEKVIALYVPISSEINHQMLKNALIPQLSSHKHPKDWISLDELPRNEQGKLNYPQLNQWLKTNLT